eukprot:3901870-Heterocapsa_arctica.AAC.1
MSGPQTRLDKLPRMLWLCNQRHGIACPIRDIVWGPQTWLGKLRWMWHREIRGQASHWGPADIVFKVFVYACTPHTDHCTTFSVAGSAIDTCVLEWGGLGITVVHAGGFDPPTSWLE